MRDGRKRDLQPQEEMSWASQQCLTPADVKAGAIVEKRSSCSPSKTAGKAAAHPESQLVGMPSAQPLSSVPQHCASISSVRAATLAPAQVSCR
jgi:hypothetical protein